MVYDLVFNSAKGRVAELAALGAANDALIAVPIETTGIVTAATMRDYTTLDALLVGASNEQTTMGRKTLTGVTSTTDQVNDRLDVDAADITWVAATGNPVSALVICWDGDTTGGTDANLVPLVCLDMVAAPAGGNITFQFNAAGFFRAS